MQQHGNLLISTEVRQFSKGQQLPEEGQVRLKPAATEVILMLF
jgi:hypothetical protein